MTLTTVDVRLEPPFAYVTMNRPEVKNALNQQMVRDLSAAFAALREDASIRAIVLSGAGGTFCAGGDLNEMRQAFSGGEVPDYEYDFERLLIAVNTAPQVVVARVEGAAMGGGFGLVCVSDIAIASTQLVMGLPEVRLGIAPAFISTYVAQRIGITRTRELMLTGRRFTAEQAKEYGLVHDVIPFDVLDDHMNILLNDLRQCSPAAIRACKALLTEIAGKPPEQTVEFRAKLLADLRAGDDAQEGIAAFMQKRAPKWSQA
jgi:enoyl-CoA hydratase/carnithine racemase